MSTKPHATTTQRHAWPRRLCVIFNPSAKGERASRFQRRLHGVTDRCEFKPTSAPGDARALAAQAVRERFDTIVAVGGDGTINEVLNGIGDVPDAFPHVALGILPLGTANVFARELRIPLRLEAAWSTIQSGSIQTIDLLRAEYQHQGHTIQRYAVQLAGAGLDARAVERVDWALKKRAGFLAYLRAGWEALAESQPLITAASPDHQAQGQLVLLGNGRLYGGPFALFPHAALQDGVLDVRVFLHADWKTALACTFGILTGRVGRAGNSIDFRTPHLTLTADRRVPLQLDGEFVGELPARFDVIPKTLRVITPP